MSKAIALFNHKRGMSKTTTSFGIEIDSIRKKVLLIDADSQCNLTGSNFRVFGDEKFGEFYLKNLNRKLKAALKPAYESMPKQHRCNRPF